jgi:hypothetical protein
VTTRIAAWLRALVDPDPMAVALRLTLLSLVLRPVGHGAVRPLVLGAAALGLLWPRALHHPALWLALALLLASRLVFGWPLGDNHAYLLCYWLLAALLASRARDGDAALAWNARALIGLVFAFAVLWKLLLSPDYLDGRFFLVTLVDDARFESFTRLAAGLDVGALSALRDLVREHQDGLRPPLPGDPALPARLVAVAQALTGSLLALESALALAFLAPAATRVSRARDAILLCFCATAYALAPVEGFGWLLLCMGAAQCEPERTLTRRAYVTVFAIVLLASRWPWLRALAD